MTGSTDQEAPDIHSSTAEYAGRFAGSAGRWFLRVQDRATRYLLADLAPGRALDVGGGHGQNLAVLADCGYTVTVLGSHPTCAERIPPDAAAFQIGSLTQIPFGEATFDLVLSYRMMTHLDDWPIHVAELCRVSRRSIVAEFPVRTGVHALAPKLFEAKKSVEGNTRPYTIFREADIVAEFQRHGWVPGKRRAQFVWPMALHRLHGSGPVGAALESVPRGLGLARAWGSPVIVRFDRGE